MLNLTIETEDKRIIDAVKALLKGYGVSYSAKLEKSTYNTSFVKKVKTAKSRMEKGDYIEVDPENLWENIESGLKQRPQEI